MENNKQVIVAFSPNDFIFFNSKDTPSREECLFDTTLYDSGECNNPDIFNTNKEKCVAQSLCANRTKAEIIIQNQNNTDDTQRHADSKTVYGNAVQTCLNRILGISIITVLIIGRLMA